MSRAHVPAYQEQCDAEESLSDVELTKHLTKVSDELGKVHIRRQRGRVDTLVLSQEASRGLAAYVRSSLRLPPTSLPQSVL
jgi:hypothetical protein